MAAHIEDLSSPKASSVNDGIERSLRSFKYSSVDEAIAIIQWLGPRTLLANTDLKDAYRMVPVHPEDRLFSAVADSLTWILHMQGVEYLLHNLDDFLLLGPTGSPICAQAVRTTKALCEEPGVQIAHEKTKGPATTLTFLGIEIDTVSLQLRLPPRKPQTLTATISAWISVRTSP